MTVIDSAFRQYLIVTGNYWAFTLTDGALRMLVVLHFHQLGMPRSALRCYFSFMNFLASSLILWAAG